jgi:hypothetical protein
VKDRGRLDLDGRSNSRDYPFFVAKRRGRQKDFVLAKESTSAKLNVRLHQSAWGGE